MSGPVPTRSLKPRGSRWRAMLAISVLWAALISGIAGYERVTTDPWRFLGENRGPIFLVWSEHLVYDRSTFGELTLVFDTQRFAAVLLVPIAALLLLAAMLPPRQAGSAAADDHSSANLTRR